MVKLTFDKQVNNRKLTGELQAAGVAVVGVETEKTEDGAFVATHIYVADETGSAQVEAIVTAHDPTPEIDLLKNDSRQWLESSAQLRQLVKASPQQIKNAVANMTPAQKDEALVLLLILAKILIKREL